jgi:hypothetical protein
VSDQTFDEDLLSVSLTEDADRFFQKCSIHDDCKQSPEMAILCAIDRGLRPLDENDLKRHFAAILLQQSLLVEEAGQREPSHDYLGMSHFRVAYPFLLRGIVRPSDSGPIELMVGADYRFKTLGRTHLFSGRLLVPGMTYGVVPGDAILMGQRIRPAQAMDWAAAMQVPRMFDPDQPTGNAIFPHRATPSLGEAILAVSDGNAMGEFSSNERAEAISIDIIDGKPRSTIRVRDDL